MRKRTKSLLRGSLHGAALVLLTLLCACASNNQSPYNRYENGAYRAPGTPDDPWGPYIIAASQRFSISDRWIRAVIKQESGGHQYLNGQPVTSESGAMGLMQLMPETYADMQSQFNLGSDPYDPHDNIMAGTGYIRFLYRKYGAPGFLAAYNAGPRRLEDYLNNGRELPNETINYVASVTPNLGTDVALTGPLLAYASTEQREGGAASQEVTEVAEAPPEQSTQRRVSDCIQNSDAAYDPSAPCPSSPVVATTQTVAFRLTKQRPVSGPLPTPTPVPCDPDAAYDTQTPCAVMPPESPRVSYAPPQAIPVESAAPRAIAATYRPAPPPQYGDYSIQVGAFSESGQARFAATMARQADFDALRGARIVLQQTPALGRGSFWRARLAGLSRNAASSACSGLQSQGMACILVPPGH